MDEAGPLAGRLVSLRSRNSSPCELIIYAHVLMVILMVEQSKINVLIGVVLEICVLLREAELVISDC